MCVVGLCGWGSGVGGVGMGDWGLGIGESKGRDLPVVIRAKAGMTPLHVRGGRVTQRITRAAKQWPGTRYHAGMFAKPDLHVAPVTPERIDAVRALRVAPAQEPFVGDPGFTLADALARESVG